MPQSQNHKDESLYILYVASPSGPLQSLYKLYPLDSKWAHLGGYMFYVG